MNGDLVGHSGDQIILRVGTKEFVVPVTGFSDADQQYIIGWIGENPDAARYKFNFFFDLEKDRGGVTQGKAQGGMVDDKLKVIPYSYELIVFNREVVDATDIEIRYEIYIDDFVNVKDNSFTAMAVGANPSATLETVAGSFEWERIPAGGRVDFSRVFNTEFYIDRDSGKTDEAATDKVLGARIRVYRDGKMIGEGIDEQPSTRGLSGIPWQDGKSSEGTVIKD
ncbi:MAG: hypothetical protein AAF357_17620 [Verrucomicrobiota bacterium]